MNWKLEIIVIFIEEEIILLNSAILPFIFLPSTRGNPRSSTVTNNPKLLINSRKVNPTRLINNVDDFFDDFFCKSAWLFGTLKSRDTFHVQPFEVNHSFACESVTSIVKCPSSLSRVVCTFAEGLRGAKRRRYPRFARSVM